MTKQHTFCSLYIDCLFPVSIIGIEMTSFDGSVFGHKLSITALYNDVQIQNALRIRQWTTLFRSY